MRIAKIRLENFMGYKEEEIAFPNNGLVLIGGPNGSGKSSIIESVAVGCWGKTVRGSTPWNGKTGKVELQFDNGLAVTRTRNGDKSSLSWASKDADNIKFESTTKAQEALETVIGTFDIWRKTCVFSQDCLNFTSATDSERKRLLESILDLSRFESALESCLNDLRCASNTKANIISKKVRMQDVIAHETVRLKSLEEKVASYCKDNKSNNDVGHTVRLLKSVESDIAANIKKLDELSDKSSKLLLFSSGSVSKIAQIESKCKLLDDSQCPTCGNEISDSFRKSTQEELFGLKNLAAKSQHQAELALLDVKNQIVVAKESLKNLNASRDSLKSELSQQKSISDSCKLLDELRLSSKRTIADSEREIFELDANLQKVELEIAELTACEKVLGLKGARSVILGRTLSGLEECANFWLEKISDSKLAVKLCAYTEKKTGGISDSISIEVMGAGGGYGYKASSTGERRRIDIALLFALFEIASFSRNNANSASLFIDEVFDSLDKDGIEKVSLALDHMAKDRLVVVITHNEELKEAINAKVRLSILNGKIWKTL